MMFTQHLPAAAFAATTAYAGITPHVRDRLVLPFEQRQKARQRARLASGLDVGIQLPRGTVLRGGDWLRSASGFLIEVIAAPEAVSTAQSFELRELARVAYHIGNRHVAVQVGDGWLRYLADHVLDAMVEGLGLRVVHDEQPFEPEAGAYSNGHRHTHRHGDIEHTHHGHGH